jgi:predicted phosphoribosyltransferase
MNRVADRCVTVATPEQLEDVAAWYEEFPRTTDAQVRTLLDAAAWRQGTNGHPPIRAPLREKLAPPPS